jgi:mRNA interferase MazF
VRVKRGEVVIIDHPFSDATGSKVRPAVVVQNDRRNVLLGETIVVLITKNLHSVHSDPTQLLIDLGTPDGKASGLNANSAVKCGNLFTIHQGLVRKQIGLLSAGLMQRVNDCLKEALELP